MHRVDLRLEAADVGQDLARPLEHPLAFRREALVALRAPHDGKADLALEPADARRERRLRHMARTRRTAEVLLPRECGQISEMAQIHSSMIDRIYHAVEAVTLTRDDPRGAML